MLKGVKGRTQKCQEGLIFNIICNIQGRSPQKEGVVGGTLVPLQN
jgi:hypothetical protein